MTNKEIKIDLKEPYYYLTRNYNAMDVIKEVIEQSDTNNQAFMLGNILKYLWRYNKKGQPLTDLKKASIYLDQLIADVEKRRDFNE